MRRSAAARHRRVAGALVSLLVSAVLAACAGGFNPKPADEVPFLERAQTQSQGELRVTAAVPSAEEARQIFGGSLYARGVQPVWVEIENGGDETVTFLPVGLDPEYFTPIETTFRARLNEPQNPDESITRFFHAKGMRALVAPGERAGGFVFTSLDEGTKSFNVDLVGRRGELYRFTFFIPVPGLKVDHREVDWESLYRENEIVELDEAGLIEALEGLPCCTTDKKGKNLGDPLNIVVVGDTKDLYYAFIRAGWDETETIYRASIVKTTLSFLFGGAYRYSPVSALYVFGRGQDAALQKARETIHERNHLRLWMTPYRFERKPVWIGQISRDIGVRFTTRTITTHKIDPNVDETREYLLEDLAYAQSLAKIGYVKGVGPAPIESPRSNLTGDPYFTDGYRVVLWVSSKPASIADIEVLDWRDPLSGR